MNKDCMATTSTKNKNLYLWLITLCKMLYSIFLEQSRAIKIALWRRERNCWELRIRMFGLANITSKGKRTRVLTRRQSCSWETWWRSGVGRSISNIWSIMQLFLVLARSIHGFPSLSFFTFLEKKINPQVCKGLKTTDKWEIKYAIGFQQKAPFHFLFFFPKSKFYEADAFLMAYGAINWIPGYLLPHLQVVGQNLPPKFHQRGDLVDPELLEQHLFPHLVVEQHLFSVYRRQRIPAFEP